HQDAAAMARDGVAQGEPFAHRAARVGGLLLLAAKVFTAADGPALGGIGHEVGGAHGREPYHRCITQAPMQTTIEPLPSTGISKSVGMCEILNDKGGGEDLFTLARDLHMPFSEVLLVIKAAEMLALIDTPGHDAQLTAFGKKTLSAPIHEKKAMLGAQMLK